MLLQIAVVGVVHLVNGPADVGLVHHQVGEEEDHVGDQQRHQSMGQGSGEVGCQRRTAAEGGLQCANGGLFDKGCHRAQKGDHPDRHRATFKQVQPDVHPARGMAPNEARLKGVPPAFGLKFPSTPRSILPPRPGRAPSIEVGDVLGWLAPHRAEAAHGEADRQGDDNAVFVGDAEVRLHLILKDLVHGC